MTAGATFTNPVYPGYFADPFVMEHRGRYYAYGTGVESRTAPIFEILGSDDLVSWEPIGHALAPRNGLADGDHWAPEVAERDGTFFMYFSIGVADTGHRIRMATAERPEGPFRIEKHALTPDEPFAIDPHPFRDADGEWYLFYARDRLDGQRVGTSLTVDRLVDMDRLAGEPVPVLSASADWQLFEAERPMYGAVYDWHTLEGPFVVKRSGRYWCFYSGGAWTNATYGVSYGVADSPLGPFHEPEASGPSILRSRPGELEGPGHNSIVRGPDGADYLVYHAWDRAHTGRRMCIDRLDWGPDGPTTAGPTVAPQPVPRGAAKNRSEER